MPDRRTKPMQQNQRRCTPWLRGSKVGVASLPAAPNPIALVAYSMPPMQRCHASVHNRLQRLPFIVVAGHERQLWCSQKFSVLDKRSSMAIALSLNPAIAQSVLVTLHLTVQRQGFRQAQISLRKGRSRFLLLTAVLFGYRLLSLSKLVVKSRVFFWTAIAANRLSKNAMP